MFKILFLKVWRELTKNSKNKWSAVPQKLKVEKITMFQSLLLNLMEIPEAKEPSFDMVEYIISLIKDDSTLAEEPFSVIFSNECVIPSSITRPFPLQILEMVSNSLSAGLKMIVDQPSKELALSSQPITQPYIQCDAAKGSISHENYFGEGIDREPYDFDGEKLVPCPKAILDYIFDRQSDNFVHHSSVSITDYEDGKEFLKMLIEGACQASVRIFGIVVVTYHPASNFRCCEEENHLHILHTCRSSCQCVILRVPSKRQLIRSRASGRKELLPLLQCLYTPGMRFVGVGAGLKFSNQILPYRTDGLSEEFKTCNIQEALAYFDPHKLPPIHFDFYRLYEKRNNGRMKKGKRMEENKSVGNNEQHQETVAVTDEMNEPLFKGFYSTIKLVLSRTIGVDINTLVLTTEFNEYVKVKNGKWLLRELWLNKNCRFKKTLYDKAYTAFDFEWRDKSFYQKLEHILDPDTLLMAPSRDPDHYWNVTHSKNIFLSFLYSSFPCKISLNKFLSGLVDWQDRNIKNTLILKHRSYPPTETDCILEALTYILGGPKFVGIIPRALTVHAGRCPFQNCVDKEMIWWHNPNFARDFLLKLGPILSGDPCRVMDKHQEYATLKRTPVLITGHLQDREFQQFKDSVAIFEVDISTFSKEDVTNARIHPAGVAHVIKQFIDAPDSIWEEAEKNKNYNPFNASIKEELSDFY
ncbi:hypothetical protein QYM36_012032 [Artemia franciscana]|uniref:Parvovirus non-structural protein 1 helicase domain-containing protein n=1 Tax=Artemia franciscana TaxID=6661 RepID=A0AA88L7B0_ARTSF|nr:hypothetical protein QYM36_012032 [Artemia franciscana]